MTSYTTKIPFVNLRLQHHLLQPQISQAIESVLQKGDFILGRALSDFEEAFAIACGVQYGIGVASGTDAIALGLQACGIALGDEVIVPANTFVATLIGVLRTGATPILVDCDPQTGLIDLMAAEKAITPRTRAIVPVHLYGQMVSPHPLLDLAGTYDLIIFEDAAQAHLAECDGYRAGSIGTAAAFSFYPSKNLGAMGDGGMVVTQDQGVAQLMRSLRNYGAPRKHYHTDLGTNSRLDTLQAAILSAKLPYLLQWNRDRYQAAQLYNSLLKPLQSQGILPIENHCDTGHVYHLYVIRVTAQAPLTRDQLQIALEERGIQTGIHYPLPVHLQPSFQHLGYKTGNFPHTENLSQEILSLPMYPGLTIAQIHQVVKAIESAVPAADRSQLAVLLDQTKTAPSYSFSTVG